MPSPAGIETILSHGKPKYGWLWLPDDQGDWWGAQSRVDYLYQVRNEPPDFPTRRWSSNLGGGYTPQPNWAPRRERFPEN